MHPQWLIHYSPVHKIWRFYAQSARFATSRAWIWRFQARDHTFQQTGIRIDTITVAVGNEGDLRFLGKQGLKFKEIIIFAYYDRRNNTT